MIGRLVDVDSMHVKSRNVEASVPVSVLPNLCHTLAQRLAAVVDTNVTDAADIGKGVQARHLLHIMRTGKRQVARPTIGIHHNEEVGIRVSCDTVCSVRTLESQSMWVSPTLWFQSYGFPTIAVPSALQLGGMRRW